MWRWVSGDLAAMRPHWDNPEAHADAPFTLATVYLVQTREAKKTSGRIVLDDVGVDLFRAGN